MRHPEVGTYAMSSSCPLSRRLNAQNRYASSMAVSALLDVLLELRDDRPYNTCLGYLGAYLNGHLQITAPLSLGGAVFSGVSLGG